MTLRVWCSTAHSHIQTSTYLQAALGLLYLGGNGVKQDMFRSAELFRQSAEQGHAVGQICLAVCYQENVGVERRYREARRLYALALAQGHPDAAGRLKKVDEIIKNDPTAI